MHHYPNQLNMNSLAVGCCLKYGAVFDLICLLYANPHDAGLCTHAGTTQRWQLVWELGRLLHLRSMVWVRHPHALQGVLHGGRTRCWHVLMWGDPVVSMCPSACNFTAEAWLHNGLPVTCFACNATLASHLLEQEVRITLGLDLRPISAALNGLPSLNFREPYGNCRCEALAAVGLDVATSEAQLRACEFLLSQQCEDGGWGESYLSCQDKVLP